MKKDYCTLLLQGIKEGDQIGGPYKLAKIFSKSLKLNNRFNEDDLRRRYLNWWASGAFDTGPTYASVFNKIQKVMDAKLAVKKFMKNLIVIQLVVDQFTGPRH